MLEPSIAANSSPPHMETTSSAAQPPEMGTHHRPVFQHASTSFGTHDWHAQHPHSHHHHLPHLHLPSASSDSTASSHPAITALVTPSDWPPHRDAPVLASTKEEAESTALSLPESRRQSAAEIYAHAHRPQHHYQPLQQAQPSQAGRGLYPTRRVPSGMKDALAARGADLRGRLMGKEGGLGRALILGWVITTGVFIVATAFWRGQLFRALDRLSKDLYSQGLYGKTIFGLLILLTTIPPLPLYSTLMVLAGYTFGVWEGFVVSYLASIIGAVLVFVLSRSLLRDTIGRALSSSPTAQSLLHIIPANPHLLLLIRIAPYPYNLLNVILASSPALSLKTYTACTAVSLFKLVLHTWIGAGIHDLSSTYAHEHEHGQGHWPGAEGGVGDAGEGGAGSGSGEWGYPDKGNHGYGYEHDYGAGHGHRPHGHHPPPWMVDELHRQRVRMISTWVGIALCVALFFYLTHLAKRALARAQAEAEEEGEAGLAFMDMEEA